MTKRCTKCGVEKPLEEFHKARKSPDGRQYRCKECSISASRQYAIDHPDARRAADRKYSASDKSKANRKARREGPQRETILEQKRQSWDRHKEEAARRAREARVADPERFREYYQRKYAAKRDEILAANRAWAVANPEKVRAAHRRRNYGLTQEEFDRKLTAQDGLCEICGTELDQAGDPLNGKRRSGTLVDHCHETGTVRGLICPSCNKALGYFKDDPARMRAAADYIERYRREIAAQPETA